MPFTALEPAALGRMLADTGGWMATVFTGQAFHNQPVVGGPPAAAAARFALDSLLPMLRTAAGLGGDEKLVGGWAGVLRYMHCVRHLHRRAVATPCNAFSCIASSNRPPAAIPCTLMQSIEVRLAAATALREMAVPLIMVVLDQMIAAPPDSRDYGEPLCTGRGGVLLVARRGQRLHLQCWCTRLSSLTTLCL